jgi:hypothetical protein
MNDTRSCRPMSTMYSCRLSQLLAALICGWLLATVPAVAQSERPTADTLTRPPLLPSAGDDENDPEIPGPALTIPSSCPVNPTCSPSACVQISPMSPAGDDAAVINACLNACRCVQLVPRTDPATGKVFKKFLLRQPIGVAQGQFQKFRLIGPPPGQPLPVLAVAANACALGKFFNEANDRFAPIIFFNRTTDAVIGADTNAQGFRVKASNLRQSCRNHTLRESFAIDVNNSRNPRISQVHVFGELPARNTDSGGGNIGGIRASFSPGARLIKNRIENIAYAIGDHPTNCETASGVQGIKVADSKNALIDDNDLVHSAFGIALVNENDLTGCNPDGQISCLDKDSSGSVVTNNRIVGASGLQCQIIGDFANGQCAGNLQVQRTNIRCSQGRALRLQGFDGGSPARPVADACVQGNVATSFGGREQQLNGSGLDLSGTVERALIRNNSFDGRCSEAEFIFQPRQTDTRNNILQGNVFLGGPGSFDVNFQSVGGVEVVPDQCGLGRRMMNAGNNQFRTFQFPDRAAPGFCTLPASAIPTPPIKPPVPMMPACPTGAGDTGLPPKPGPATCPAPTMPPPTGGDTTLPTVTVAAPNGGESLTAGQGTTISWQSADDVGVASHEVAYSTNGGSTFVVIAASLPGTQKSFVWLVPNTPTTNARVRVTARDAAGNVQADSSNGAFAIANVAMASQLTATPTSLSFAGTVGGAPQSKTVQIGSTGQPRTFTVSDNASWLTLNPTGGQTPATVNAQVSLASLTAQTYNATITVSSSGVPSLQVPVTLTVSASGGGGGGGGGGTSGLAVSPAALNVNAIQFEDPGPRTLFITSTTGSPLAWSATVTGSFLSVTPASGTTAGSTFVNFQGALGLAPGTYTGSVAVTAPGINPVTIPVALTIRRPS